ncbi:MAG: PilZ domain-containing protein [Desulfuromonadales bacterium]|nr:PilZ domain-containing protein [Desulfuromonadales bacterium]
MAELVHHEQAMPSAPENLRPFPVPTRQPKTELDQAQLINRLNRLNFKQEPLLVHLRHKLHGNALLRHAIPQPCLDEHLECLWVDPEDADNVRLQVYALEHLVMADGQKVVQIEPTLISINGRQLTVRLPAKCAESLPRAVRRHRCDGVKASIVANSAVYEGHLIDFNALFFRIQLRAQPPQSFDWIGTQVPVNVTLQNGQGVIYVGDCRIVRQTHGEECRDYVLQPTRNQTPRFRSREFRSVRYELFPCPNAVFEHPVTHRTMNLKLIDVSGAGFALAEPAQEATLLPGMVLKKMAIHLTSRAHMECTAQVIHRTPVVESDIVKVGLALVDIGNLDHMELVSLLQQAKDPDTYVSNKVDLETLWDFFFETGFIYPEKYASLAENKETFRSTYAKLYTEHPTIARHFIHMEHGKILGHFAMLRLFEKTWVNHHHAALQHKRKSGFLVLDRMSEYINDTHAMHSAHIRYNAGYYRTDNKFPVRFFGGFAEKMNNPRACSVDEFGFFNFQGLPSNGDWDDNGRWELSKVRRGDLEDLQGFYQKASGGLMLDAIDMTPESLDLNTLSEEYAKAGFRREVHRLAIKKNGELKAVIAVNRTDVGLNFSELTNATKLLVVDGSGFSKRDFQLMMSMVAVKFGMERFPLLVYPLTYLASAGIPHEKIYAFNVMSLHYWDDYMRYLRDFMKKAKVN